MENVFADLNATISTSYSAEEAFVKPKRSAFVFITAESDSSHIVLEDLRN